MVNVLADLAIESEAATATALRLARAYDEGDTALRRFATAVLKYWICKRATPARRRGARVPGRQRLRRGVADAAAAARRAAQRHLGGLGQRDGARRPARDGARARGPAGLPRRVRARPRRRRPARRAPRRAAGRWRARRPDAQWSPAARSRTSRSPSRPSLLVRHAPPRWPTRSAPGASARRAAAPSGRCPPASTARPSSPARWRSDAPRPLVDCRADEPARAARRGARRRGDQRPRLRQP